jgi:hypothetical protein
LRREPDHEADPDRIIVLSARGVPIGRLTRQYAGLIAPLLDRGRPHRARLHCLRGGLPGYPNYGARISIAWDGRRELAHRPLDERQERYRHRQRADVVRTAAPIAVVRPQAGRAVTVFRSDRDTALLAFLLLCLALGALAVYKLAEAISSACWVCG